VRCPTKVEEEIIVPLGPCAHCGSPVGPWRTVVQYIQELKISIPGKDDCTDNKLLFIQWFDHWSSYLQGVIDCLVDSPLLSRSVLACLA